MNEIIDEFKDYLLNTKYYSTNTVVAYDFDIHDLIAFMQKYNNTQIRIADIANADTLVFRSWLADRARRN